jgi:hypothetical protein
MYPASELPETGPGRKRLSRGWKIFARIFVGINIAGFIFAARDSEPMHAAGHLLLLLVGLSIYMVWRYAGRSEPEPIPLIDPTNDVLDRLQQSVDKIALEVERVGESQRFHAKILEKRIAQPTQTSK